MGTINLPFWPLSLPPTLLDLTPTATSYVWASSSTSNAAVSSLGHEPSAVTDLSQSFGAGHYHQPSFESLPPSSSSSSRTSSTWGTSSSASSVFEDTGEGLPYSTSVYTTASSSPSRKGKEPAPNSPPSDRYDIIHEILTHEDLYDVLGITKDADVPQLRKAYITRSKRCHPDKFPEYPSATLAFQKISFAYDVLSHPPTRKAYDRSTCSGFGFQPHFHSPSFEDESQTGFNYQSNPDDTLNSVLYGVFCDFMDGDLEMLRTFLRAMGELNSRMRIDEQAIESLVESLLSLRQVLLSGQKYARIVRFELIRMYEIQSSLRALSYFDVRGRLRLTLQLARVTLSLPVVVDLAMRNEDDPSDDEADEPSRRRPSPRRGLANGRDLPRVKLGRVPGRRKRGLLPPPVSVVIGLAIGVLEVGERVL